MEWEGFKNAVNVDQEPCNISIQLTILLDHGSHVSIELLVRQEAAKHKGSVRLPRGTSWVQLQFLSA